MDDLTQEQRHDAYEHACEIDRSEIRAAGLAAFEAWAAHPRDWPKFTIRQLAQAAYSHAWMRGNKHERKRVEALIQQIAVDTDFRVSIAAPAADTSPDPHLVTFRFRVGQTVWLASMPGYVVIEQIKDANGNWYLCKSECGQRSLLAECDLSGTDGKQGA